MPHSSFSFATLVTLLTELIKIASRAHDRGPHFFAVVANRYRTLALAPLMIANAHVSLGNFSHTIVTPLDVFYFCIRMEARPA